MSTSSTTPASIYRIGETRNAIVIGPKAIIKLGYRVRVIHEGNDYWGVVQSNGHTVTTMTLWLHTSEIELEDHT